MTLLCAYAATLVLFLAADMVWLGTMTGRFYRPILGDLLLAKPNLIAAGVFYFAYPLGVVIFAVLPALRGGGWQQAALWGGLFGLFTYGTYDLTNQATLRNWSTALTVVDMTWGAVLGAFAAAGATWITARVVS